MTGYTPGDTRTAEQQRWSDYYLTRDLDEAGPALHLLGSPSRVPPTGRLDSTVVDAVLSYHPVDTRSKREKRDNKARYGKAKTYYGKTYIVPRREMIWTVVLGFGVAMMVGAVTAISILHAVN